MNRIISALFALSMGVLLFVGSDEIQASDQALDLVKDVTNKITGSIKAQKAAISKNPELVVKLVNDIVLPHFDFDRMSKKALGKSWEAATTDQKNRFIKEFKQLLVRTYSKALADNADNQIDFLESKVKKNGQLVLVRTEVQQSAGFPIPLNYKMYQPKGRWMVYDVVIDGISLVANYRTSFAKEIKSSGFDKLIASLADKNKK